MRLYKLFFAGLILSLTILSGILLQQTTFAEEDSLACADLNLCNPGPSCKGAGTQKPNCIIECSPSGVIQCPTGGLPD